MFYAVISISSEVKWELKARQTLKEQKNRTEPRRQIHDELTGSRVVYFSSKMIRFITKFKLIGLNYQPISMSNNSP